MLFKYIQHLLYILFAEHQNGLVGSFLFCALFCTSFSDSIDLFSDLKFDLAKIGLGIACIPDYCITGKDLEKLFIVETKEKLPVRELVIAYNDRVPITKAATEFLKYF